MKKIAELKFKLYDDGNGSKTSKIRGQGTGADELLLIADFIVTTAKDHNFPYEEALELLKNMCDTLADSRKN